MAIFVLIAAAWASSMLKRGMRNRFSEIAPKRRKFVKRNVGGNQKKMKIKFVLILIYLANTLSGQIAESVSDEVYFWRDSQYFIKVNLGSSQKFEFIINDYDDCTPAFAFYGEGSFKIDGDSILFHFDSIPQTKSTSETDSILNEDEIVDIKIRVVDQNGASLEKLTLSWGKPITKGKWTSAAFFSRPFNANVVLQLYKYEKMNFVRIEKEGFDWADIKLPTTLDKDYFVKVTLRPEPEVRSNQYLPSGMVKFPIFSNCEIGSFEGKVLKKESCH